MTIEQAIINIEKELKCRQHRKEEIYCENTICMDCLFSVGYEDLTDTLQTLYNWLSAEKGCKGCKSLRFDNICKNDRCARIYKDRYSRGE